MYRHDRENFAHTLPPKPAIHLTMSLTLALTRANRHLASLHHKELCGGMGI